MKNQKELTKAVLVAESVDEPLRINNGEAEDKECAEAMVKIFLQASIEWQENIDGKVGILTLDSGVKVIGTISELHHFAHALPLMANHLIAGDTSRQFEIVRALIHMGVSID